MRRFRSKGELTDLILSHEDGRFNVHQIIICPQSKVIHKACSGGFKVNTIFRIKNNAEMIKQENSTGIIEMADMSYLELEKMVDFFYSMDYDAGIPEDAEPENPSHMYPLQLHARMFALGDRYDISGLRDVAVKKYSSRCTGALDSLEFIESIHDVYETTPMSVRQLREAACSLMRRDLPQRLDDEAFRTVYEKVLVEVPEFTRDMLGLYVRAPVYRNCSTCCSYQAFEALQMRCKLCGKGRSGW